MSSREKHFKLIFHEWGQHSFCDHVFRSGLAEWFWVLMRFKWILARTAVSLRPDYSWRIGFQAGSLIWLSSLFSLLGEGPHHVSLSIEWLECLLAMTAGFFQANDPRDHGKSWNIFYDSLWISPIITSVTPSWSQKSPFSVLKGTTQEQTTRRWGITGKGQK